MKRDDERPKESSAFEQTAGSQPERPQRPVSTAQEKGGKEMAETNDKTRGGRPQPGNPPSSRRDGVRRQRRALRGPKTPEGKARVRLNAVRHGLCASSPVIPDVERAQDWEAHRAAVLEDRAPVGYLETLLAERIASVFWRLNRVAPYEAAQTAKWFWREERVGVPPNDTIDKIVRYEAHLSRQLYQSDA